MLRRIHRPALARRVGGRVLDLAGDGLLRIGEVLVGALAGVDGGDHRDSFMGTVVLSRIARPFT